MGGEASWKFLDLEDERAKFVCTQFVLLVDPISCSPSSETKECKNANSAGGEETNGEKRRFHWLSRYDMIFSW